MHHHDAHVTIGDVGVVVSPEPLSEHRSVSPAPGLRPYVAAYGGYRDVGVAPTTHRGLPSPYLTVIVTLDDDLEMLDGGRRSSFSTLVAGLHLAPVTVVHDGRQSGIQISLHPLGARALFACPTAALGTAHHVAADVAPRWVDELQDRVRSAPDWPARFEAVDAVLLGVLQPATIERPLQAAWRALAVGGRPVGEVADAVGWTPRRLSREFGTEYGLSPKTVARLGRFDRARRELLHAPTVPLLADLAVRHGFYDQAHLAREFRDLAGVPPSTWLAEERRSVQADHA